jgi:cation diffusion facilitator CzcD-associated flavoprotein CzcO
LVVDAAPSVGGPWASHRIFLGLKTNNLLGTYETPDFVMDGDRFGIVQGEHIPAEKVLDYLRAFAHESGISHCVRLDTKVETIEKTDGHWKLYLSSTLANSDGNDSRSSINTAKLIIAVGLVNEPAMPCYPTSPDFAPMVIHSKDFPAHFSDIAKAGAHTLVIGGAKSAWDVAYACATQPDSTVTMLIRPSGNGPMWMSPPYVTPLGLWLEKLVFTRFFWVHVALSVGRDVEF